MHLLLDDPELALRLPDEALVVADDDHPSVILLDRLQTTNILKQIRKGNLEGATHVSKRVDGLDVEVVGGLIEDDDVGRGERELGQRHARLLPAGQVLHSHLGAVQARCALKVHARYFRHSRYMYTGQVLQVQGRYFRYISGTLCPDRLLPCARARPGRSCPGLAAPSPRAG